MWHSRRSQNRSLTLLLGASVRAYVLIHQERTGLLNLVIVRGLTITCWSLSSWTSWSVKAYSKAVMHLLWLLQGVPKMSSHKRGKYQTHKTRHHRVCLVLIRRFYEYQHNNVCMHCWIRLMPTPQSVYYGHTITESTYTAYSVAGEFPVTPSYFCTTPLLYQPSGMSYAPKIHPQFTSHWPSLQLVTEKCGLCTER